MSWIKLSQVIGTNVIPKNAAIIIDAALKQAVENGHVNYRNRWQFIEYLCADYLAGREDLDNE